MHTQKDEVQKKMYIEGTHKKNCGANIEVNTLVGAL